MAVSYAYNYAEIDPSTGMCVGIYSASVQSSNPYWVEIPTDDDEYFMKYYSFETGKWYYDAEMTQEYIPA